MLDSITPGNDHYSEKSRLAKTIQKDGVSWGDARVEPAKLAHDNSRMTCYACHSSWAPTCFGCHLSMTANQRMPMLHNEGLITRNWTSYNFQVLRDDIYMLGIDGTVTGNRVAPVRSACAVLVSSQNADRDWIYYQQQTISAEGFSGQAFSTFVPHTVRAKETKQCTDCHVSKAGDNNAWMSQLLMQGTNFMNFMGRYIYVATGSKGYEAVAVTEHDEPPAVIGSDLQKLAYPADYNEHIKKKLELTETYGHAGSDILHHSDEILDVQARGEYLYAAMGRGGFRIYDIANLDDKDFSQRTITAPVSPWGQRFYVPTKYAMAVATPTTLGVDPLRTQNPENEEQKICPHLRLPLCRRQRRGPDRHRQSQHEEQGRHRCRDIARWQSLEQLHQSRQDLQSRWHPWQARAVSPSPAPTPTSCAITDWWLWTSPIPSIPRSPRKSARHSWSNPQALRFSSATRLLSITKDSRCST